MNTIMKQRYDKLQLEIAAAAEAGKQAALNLTNQITNVVTGSSGNLVNPIGSISSISYDPHLNPVYISSIAAAQEQTLSALPTTETTTISSVPMTTTNTVTSSITTSKPSTDYTVPISLLVLGITVFYLTKK